MGALDPDKGCSRNYPRGVGGNGFLSGGWMHNNVKFVLRDEDIQVNIIRSWYSDLSWGWAFVPFRMCWGWRSQKIAAHPPENNFWNSPNWKCKNCVPLRPMAL